MTKMCDSKTIHKTEGVTLNKDGDLFEERLKEEDATCLGMLLVMREKTLLGMQQRVFHLIATFGGFCV